MVVVSREEVEQGAEQPSWPDLLVTSTVGALIGEARWWARNELLDAPELSLWRGLGLLLVDPVTLVEQLFTPDS